MPATVTTALLTLVGGLSTKDVEVFPNVSTARELSFVVRFYTRSKTALTGCTTLGEMPVLLASNVSAGLAVSVGVLVAGLVPEADMPIDAAKAAKASGEAAVEAADTVATAATVVEVIAVCGDAVYVTVESCDDGNRVDGDGCGFNCTVEDGFQCRNRIGRASDCFVPTDPTVGFSATAYGPFDEGTTANVTVTRLGDNDTVVSVFYQTADSTATHRAVDNNMYSPGAAAGGEGHATWGDYVGVNGTLTFAAGETRKEIEIILIADTAYDGTVNEQFAIVLSNVVDAELLDGFTTAYVAIADYDVEPSAAPTLPPSQLPSPVPSAAPTSAPTSTPTQTPSVPPSPAPSQTPTSAPTFAPPPPAPTSVPTPAPTPIPSPVPSQMPSPLPTPVPSLSCSAGTSLYRLRLYDAGGDGWGSATYKLSYSASAVVVSTGTLSSGTTGNEWLCLADECFMIQGDGGSADSEVGFKFEDSSGGYFEMQSGPFSAYFCVAGGRVYGHPTPSPTLSGIPSGLPTPLPSASPTAAPSPVPSAHPSTTPTITPTPPPSPLPSGRPSSSPSSSPTSAPTSLPSIAPTPLPSPQPTSAPTSLPSYAPTPLPSPQPTSAPTSLPSYAPTPVPSPQPTEVPTTQPTASPTPMPSGIPTTVPSALPAPSPTAVPSAMPSALPVPEPTSYPTHIPTPVPSVDCEGGREPYLLRMYASGGAGWSGATYAVYNSSSVANLLEGGVVASGTLDSGFAGYEWVCLIDG